MFKTPKVRADAWYTNLYSWGFIILGGFMVLVGFALILASSYSADYSTLTTGSSICIVGLVNVGIGCWNYNRLQNTKRRIARYSSWSRDWGREY